MCTRAAAFTVHNPRRSIMQKLTIGRKLTFVVQKRNEVPKPETLNAKPETLSPNSKPQTLNSKTQTFNPKPQTPKAPNPKSPKPQKAPNPKKSQKAPRSQPQTSRLPGGHCRRRGAAPALRRRGPLGWTPLHCWDTLISTKLKAYTFWGGLCTQQLRFDRILT